MKTSIDKAIAALKKIAKQDNSNLSEISIRIRKIEKSNPNGYPPLPIIE